MYDKGSSAAKYADSSRDAMIDKFSDTPNFQAQMNQIKLSERTIQELKVLAFEYVKQIVAKANELSQNVLATTTTTTTTTAANTESADGSTTTTRGPTLAGESNKSQQFILISPADRGRVCEAAVQINKQFRFTSSVPPLKGTRGEKTSKPKSVTYHRDISHSPKDSKPVHMRITYDNNAKSSTTSTTQNNIPVGGRDYVEQDYATMSSSQEETNEPRFNQGSHAREKESGRRFKAFQQRFNWHLLVSCFSTCLPDNLTQQTMSRSSSNTGPSAV